MHPHEEESLEGVESADLFPHLANVPADKLATADAQAPPSSITVPYASAEPNSDDPFAYSPGKQERKHVAKSWIIPATLLGIGWACYIIMAFLNRGVVGAAMAQVHVVVGLGVSVIMCMVACLLVARLVGATIGRLDSALLRMAAVVVFPLGISLFVPYLGEFIIQPLLFWFLLTWFFDLNLVEGFILAQIMWLMHFLAFMFVGIIGMSMMLT